MWVLFNEINPLRDLWNTLCVWNLPSASEMPAGVRGFISFRLMQSIKFHNDRRSLFHIRRIFHFNCMNDYGIHKKSPEVLRCPNMQSGCLPPRGRRDPRIRKRPAKGDASPRKPSPFFAYKNDTFKTWKCHSGQDGRSGISTCCRITEFQNF